MCSYRWGGGVVGVDDVDAGWGEVGALPAGEVRGGWDGSDYDEEDGGKNLYIMRNGG